jgi:cytochrome bd-type quinol oxidase subunit 2
MDLGEMFPDIAKFSLANSIEDSNTVLSNGNNTYILYFGIILLVIIIGYFIYKFYFNQKRVRFSDKNDINEINNNYN